MSKLLLPRGYKPLLDELATECAIRKIKNQFQADLAFELKLQRVTAPLFVLSGTGINDNLNGVEKPVSFGIKDIAGKQAEIVHSLAKWKRLKLATLEMSAGKGIYTDMNAIRPDEELDNLHSLYVDQWDWEKVITKEQRTLEYLKDTVRRIYYAIRRTEASLCQDYPQLRPFLPEEIKFHFTEDLEAKYPSLTPKEREDKIAKQDGAVFIIGIGGALPLSGKPHDGRSPDYDDWSTASDKTHHGLNGDIVVWNPVLGRSFELSSMGIRVDRTSLKRQLKLAGQQAREKLFFHQALLKGELPLTMGGGIGQSRLCMLFLQKAHIGEIQCSIWPDAMIAKCREHHIPLL
jgi:aspartate--ammonia ligase